MKHLSISTADVQQCMRDLEILVCFFSVVLMSEGRLEVPLIKVLYDNLLFLYVHMLFVKLC